MREGSVGNVSDFWTESKFSLFSYFFFSPSPPRPLHGWDDEQRGLSTRQSVIVAATRRKRRFLAEKVPHGWGRFKKEGRRETSVFTASSGRRSCSSSSRSRSRSSD